ncbi:hypothetical protein [Streptomyces lydicus]|uniref:hypothetical protein n=1 Tax=Streptomyces lydicus TaxID=47763 RepID=UPI0037CDE1EC
MDLSADGIRETSRVVHAWWQWRQSLSPLDLARCVNRLCAAASHLEVRAQGVAGADVEDPDLRSVLTRMMVTAAAIGQPAVPILWQTACLATAVCDLLSLLEQPENEGAVA